MAGIAGRQPGCHGGNIEGYTTLPGHLSGTLSGTSFLLLGTLRRKSLSWDPPLYSWKAKPAQNWSISRKTRKYQKSAGKRSGFNVGRRSEFNVGGRSEEVKTVGTRRAMPDLQQGSALRVHGNTSGHFSSELSRFSPHPIPDRVRLRPPSPPRRSFGCFLRIASSLTQNCLKSQNCLRSQNCLKCQNCL